MHKIIMLIVILALAATLHAADAVPYGHKDFVPTPEQPIGYRGDGTGIYPGATPPTEFWEGTPVAQKSGKDGYQAAEDDGKSKNILWKTEMPCWGSTQPIVVGKKVFTKADPNLLICVDADTGKILWTRTINAWEIGGVEKSLAEKLQVMHEILLYDTPNWGAMLSNGTMTGNMPYDNFLPLTEVYKQALPQILAALKELDPGFSYEAAAKSSLAGIDLILASKKENKAIDKDISRNGPWNGLANAISRRIFDLGPTTVDIKDKKGRRVGIPLASSWGNLVGFSSSTPVSDGTLVYTAFLQGQIVAYDLDGNLVWARIIHPGVGDTWQSVVHYPSPVLVDGILLVQDVKTLFGLDAKTGKTLWSTDGAVTIGSHSIGTPKVVTLNNGAEKLRVLVTTTCKIVRVSDGKIVGILPWEHDRMDGGSSITSVDNIVVKGANGDGFHKPLTAFRLTLKDKDTVEAVKEKEIGNSIYQAIVVTEGLKVFAQRDQGGSTILAGEYLIRGSCAYWGPWSKYGVYSISQLQPDGKEKPISKTNVLIQHTPRMPVMEKYAPELYKILPSFSANMIGAPSFFSYCDSENTVQGDRLYVRSTSYLYCIGKSDAKSTEQKGNP